MTAQTQATNESNIYGIGIGNIEYNGYNLGATQGGVVVTVTTEVYRQVIDKYGSTPIKIYEMATSISAVVPLKEETTAQLNRIIQSGTISGDNKLTFGKQVGTEITAARLIILPLDSNAHDIIIYKAVPIVNMNLTYSSEGERIYNVEFIGVIDTDRAENDKLFRMDESYSI